MKWNKSSDGNPRVKGAYLISANDIVNSWVEICFFNGEKWVHESCFDYPAIIDAWQDLPETYKATSQTS